MKNYILRCLFLSGLAVNGFLLLLMFYMLVSAEIITTSDSVRSNPDTLDVLYNHSDYTAVIEGLKTFESFRSCEYIGVAGEVLIGYGHKRVKGQSFGGCISVYKADSILNVDFGLCVTKMHERTSLRGKRLLAVSALAFNTGIYRVLNSSLLTKIQMGCDVSSEWTSWCKYHHRNKVFVSSHLRSRRIWEFQIYNLGLYEEGIGRKSDFRSLFGYRDCSTPGSTYSTVYSGLFSGYRVLDYLCGYIVYKEL